MFRVVMLCTLCLAATGCATNAPSKLIKVDDTSGAQAAFKVQPLSRKSASLFAIENPLTRAIEARWNGNETVAYTHFYTAWLATPENEGVVIGFIDMALKTGHLSEAYAAASQLTLNLETAPPALLAAQVLAEIAVGKSLDPELRLNQALESSPDDPRLWNALGRFHDSNGSPLLARDYYLQALATGGSRASAMNNLGMSLLTQGEKSAALVKFEQAVDIDPSTPLYDNNRRLALALDGNYSGAIDGLPDNRKADILNDAGYIAKVRNDDVQAAALFKAAIDISTTYHPSAHANLASLQKSK